MTRASISHRRAEAPPDAASIDAELALLERLDLGELRLRWRNRFGRAASTNLPRHLLTRLLAYRIQVDMHGGLSRGSERLLDRMASDKDDARNTLAELKPGTLLTREWQGRLEQVMAMTDGFTWRGRTFHSLSGVATAITGTRWNGRRFFGLPGGKEVRSRRAPGAAGAEALS